MSRAVLLDRVGALQLVVQATAPVDVVIGQVGLGDLRRRQGQVMGCPVPLDELVLDDPVDLPRDGVEVPCPDRVQRPLPQSEDARADRVRAAVAGEVPRLGQVLALDVERARSPAVR